MSITIKKSNCSQRININNLKCSHHFAVLLVLLFMTLGCHSPKNNCSKTRQAKYENIAFGKRCSLLPRPNYSLCKDPGDNTQLTDGKKVDRSKGKFWTQKSAVGWSRKDPVITLDLENDYPISGLSYNTAAGGGDVEWPASIEVLVSLDGKAYHLIGDLVTLSKKRPPAAGSNVGHCFQTDKFKVHGRYLKLIIHPTKNYTFVDEIEVFRGEDAWKKLPLPGRATRYPKNYYSPFLKATMPIWSDDPFNALVCHRIDEDLHKASSALANAKLPTKARKKLTKEASLIQKAIYEMPKYKAKHFRGTFPLNDVHARVYALYGSIRKAQDKAPIIAWNANPWDFLQPTDLPVAPRLPQINVTTMRGETRAGAVNLTNCTDQNITLEVAFDNLPGGPAPSYIMVREVAWTETFFRMSTNKSMVIAAALPVSERGSRGWKISIPAGMTRQVWFEVKPTNNMKAGSYIGEVVMTRTTKEQLRLPFKLRVFNLDFPKKPTLHLSGWSYTDTDHYGISNKNRKAFIEHLRKRYVDSPWTSAYSMAYGKFNIDGTFKTKPDTSHFDTWVASWTQARRYFIFNNVRSFSKNGGIDGTAIDDPLFAKKVGTWIRFWAEHMRKKGINPNQWYLLAYDEPSRDNDARVIIAWAKAIKAAEPEVNIFCDPLWKDPKQAPPEFWGSLDLICPNLPMLLSQGQEFEMFYRKQKLAGKRLALYSCNGAKTFDPYTYYRLQAWFCFDIGAEESMFWAFGDAGGKGASSWNEYATQKTAFSPLFISPNTITPGKHMEAIREGVEDFEYLVMLRNKIQQLTKNGSSHALLPEARALLNNGVNRVLKDLKDIAAARREEERVSNLSLIEAQMVQGDKVFNWKANRDRTLADSVRIEIGDMLEKLNQ